MRLPKLQVVGWGLLVLGSLVFLVYMLADIGFLFSGVSVWPGTWIYGVFGAAQLGTLAITGYVTVAQYGSRRRILRNLLIAVWALNLTSDQPGRLLWVHVSKAKGTRGLVDVTRAG